MGRLVGIGSLLAVIAIAGLFLGFGAYFVEDHAGDGSSAALQASGEADSLSVDPACLWPVLDSAVSPDAAAAPARVKLQNCAPPGAKIETDGDWIRVSLQNGRSDDPDAERRFSGIRVAALSDDRMLTLEAYDNWGGSGVFSSLISGRLSSDGEVLDGVKVHAFGDRCNGGLAGTSIGVDGQVRATANMTPWDILVAPFAGLSLEAQWAAAQERYGSALANAPSCAACCSAVTHEYEVGGDGTLTSVGLRQRATEAESSPDPLTACLEKAVRTAAGDEGLVADNELVALASLIDRCAQEVSK